MDDLRQREPSIEIPVLRELVRGAPCMFRIPGVCRGRDDTTCWCHSNEGRHGKGAGKKAHDIFGAIGCKDCHDWYDFESRRAATSLDDLEERRRAFDVAHIRSMIYLHRNGHLKFVRGRTP